MAIIPETELYLLKGIPLDNDYTNTIRFKNEREQQRYIFKNVHVIHHFYNAANVITKAIYYQRKDNNIVCVGLPIANCFNCNYIAFKNTMHEGKWFYAFVTKVEYANEKACYIHYQIDVMQTWMFDYTLGMSFIERQHHPTDRIGENLVPENLECGEYVNNESYEYRFNRMCVCVVTSRYIPPFKIKGSYEYIPSTFGGGHTISGVYNTLYYYGGFVLPDDETYFKHAIKLGEYYDIQHINDGETITPLTAKDILDPIIKGEISGLNESSIVAVYQYPAWFHKSDGDEEYNTGVRAKTQKFTFSKSIDGYPKVKNNKLLTSPYTFIRCSNNSGCTSDYNFEHFKEKDYEPEFYIVGTMANPPCFMCVPKNYRGVAKDYDSGLVLNSFPMCAYVGDTYSRWLSENKNALGMSVLTTVIGGIVSVGTGTAALGAATTAAGQISAQSGIASSVSGGVGSVGKKLAKMSDLKNTPPAVYGQTQCDSLNCGIGRVKFTLYHMTIKPEMARIIDDFFTMYGYATNTVDVPNITSRPHWNYIKTINANILPLQTENAVTCIPSEDLHSIRAVYDRGITFWHNGDEVGDYSLDNSPNTPN